MDKQQYQDEKFLIEQLIDKYFHFRQDVEFEYLVKCHEDKRWIRNSKLIDDLKIKLQELKEKYYDDNRVYRTNERQLDTRIDGYIVLA